MNFSTNAPPKTTARLLRSCRRSGLTAIVFQSSSTKNAVKMNPRSPVAGVSSMNICADARSSDTSTIAPEMFSSADRRSPTRRSRIEGAGTHQRGDQENAEHQRHQRGRHQRELSRGIHAQAAGSGNGHQRIGSVSASRPTGRSRGRMRGLARPRPAVPGRGRARSRPLPEQLHRIQIGQIARQATIEFRRKFLGGVQLEVQDRSP